MHGLVIQQRHAEHLALAGVVDGLGDQVLAALDGIGGAPQALFLELHHLHHEAHAFLADQIALRHAHVVEEHLGGFRAAHAQLVERLVHGDAAGVLGHHDQGFVDVGLVVGGVGQQAEEVGAGRVGDPHLGAVDHIVVAVLFGVGLDVGHVGAGVGLGHRDRGDHVTGDGRRQVVALELVGAEAGQGGRGHVGLHADGQRHAAAGGAADFLGDDQAVGIIQTHAAVFLGLGDAQQAQVAHLLEHVVDRETSRRFPLRHERVHLFLDKITHRAAQLFMFLSKQHGRFLCLLARCVERWDVGGNQKNWWF